MKFLIITHVKHKKQNDDYFAYEPYVREMNLWLKQVDRLEVIAPSVEADISSIDAKYMHPSITFSRIPEIQFTTIGHAIRSLFLIPSIFISIFKACQRADHIHLRCPGTIGLIGCFVQVFFPKKPKTAKYAGNWDPKSKQPLSYRMQKAILRNTFWTKNMQVLVYGDFGSKSKNVRPFFTASFYEKDIEKILERDYTKSLKFVFIGSIVKGKRPLLALKIVQQLVEKGVNATIDFYGEGEMLPAIQSYVSDNDLGHMVSFKGVQSKETIKSVLKTAHFLILPSRSEGWPKVVAEAMFFGTIPIATSVSCIPFMLDHGNRGIVISTDPENAALTIMDHMDQYELEKMRRKAVFWSQKYTLEEFEKKIKELLSN